MIWGSLEIGFRYTRFGTGNSGTSQMSCMMYCKLKFNAMIDLSLGPLLVGRRCPV